MTEEIRSLFLAGEYGELRRRVSNLIHDGQVDPEISLLYGIAAAKQGDLDDAENILRTLIQENSRFAAAYAELAGVRFLAGDLDSARKLLEKSLDLDPTESYARDFLGTVYYLEGRRLPALEMWNRLGQPRIRRIGYVVPERTARPVLEKLVPINENETLQRRQLLQARWTQEMLHLGERLDFQLRPWSENLWDLELLTDPPSPLAWLPETALSNAASLLTYRRFAFLYPREPLHGTHVQFEVGWHPARRDLRASTRFRFLSLYPDALELSLRRWEEAWILPASADGLLLGGARLEGRYRVVLPRRQSVEFTAGYQQQFGDLAHLAGFLNDRQVARVGIGWRGRIGLNADDTVRLDFALQGRAFFGAGTRSDSGRQVDGHIVLHWLVRDSSATSVRISVKDGRSTGLLPLNDLYHLGVGPGEPLPLRAHKTVQRGRNGAAPLAQNCFLLNVDLTHRLFRVGILGVVGRVFFDAAEVDRTALGVTPHGWCRDEGAGLAVNIIGREVLEVIWGHDLRAGGSTFSALPPARNW
ncbi:MAG: hypothetical protein Kow001_12030 [Acidobacteriota bacterium]